MNVNTIALDQLSQFSSFFLDYISSKQSLKEFYAHSPTIQNFEKQIENKHLSDEKRNTLIEVLQDQYQGYEVSEATATNMNRLRQNNAFTITTGHQLNIFTGPLYFIYKIVTVINTCKALAEKYPSYDFVPVYWMASEDHDFDEIAYFHLFGKKYQWSNEEKGAVGRMSTTGLKEILEQLPEKPAVFERAYLDHGNLADAVRCYVNELFGDHGLVVLDADDDRLKRQFIPVIKDDLLLHSANEQVTRSSEKLSALGYKTQIFPRKINFFYLDDQIRERIVREDDVFKVLNTDLTFSEDEILKLLENSPEKFSPNVVMRPVYQEYILPNLAYIGGPSELIYWLQLGEVFSHHKLALPILMPRNFGLYVNKVSEKKMEKLGIDFREIFKKIDELQEAYLTKHSEDNSDLTEAQAQLKDVFDLIGRQSESIDGSLKGFVGGEYAKATKSVTNIEKRLKKAEQQKNETALKQIAALKDKLFPNNGLQERHDNFLNFYMNNPQFIDELIAALQPFDYSMHVMTEK